ncbi:MAG TPA: TMEM175 family protein, partial [Isosphaeraceae bacterium]|nr:TMEM175 family protein [Isosphaeraceae bacterium]
MIAEKPSSRLFRVGELSTSRIEAFSDGVFAIVITLLVLEIHVPKVQGPDQSEALARSLILMIPKFLSYLLSFSIISIW